MVDKNIHELVSITKPRTDDNIVMDSDTDGTVKISRADFKSWVQEFTLPVWVNTEEYPQYSRVLDPVTNRIFIAQKDLEIRDVTPEQDDGIGWQPESGRVGLEITSEEQPLYGEILFNKYLDATLEWRVCDGTLLDRDDFPKLSRIRTEGTTSEIIIPSVDKPFDHFISTGDSGEQLEYSMPDFGSVKGYLYGKVTEHKRTIFNGNSAHSAINPYQPTITPGLDHNIFSYRVDEDESTRAEYFDTETGMPVNIDDPNSYKFANTGLIQEITTDSTILRSLIQIDIRKEHFDWNFNTNKQLHPDSTTKYKYIKVR